MKIPSNIGGRGLECWGTLANNYLLCKVVRDGRIHNRDISVWNISNYIVNRCDRRCGYSRWRVDGPS